MLRTIVNALGVIIGDVIEGWATRMSRDELIATIRQQTERIRELEDDLDQAERDILELRGHVQCCTR